MLSAIKIQNYALIQNLDIRINQGLDIITGETGTGKSIILGAIGLILGNRADSSALMDPEKKCIIEGHFHIAKYELQHFFNTNDLDWEENTIVRREISPNGKSRAFINDTPVNLNILKEFGEQVVDIHSQYQTLKLSDPLYQITLLDAFSGNKQLLELYSSKYKDYKKTEKELINLKEKALSAKKENDYYLFQLEEIERVKAEPGEMEKLDEELSLLSNAETIKQILQFAVFSFSDDEKSINTQLASIKKQLSGIVSINHKLQQIYERVSVILIEAKDINGEIEDLNESIIFDSQRQEQVATRISEINHILTKHQLSTEDELITYGLTLQEKINYAESLDSNILVLEKQYSLLQNEVSRYAAELSKVRKKEVRNLAANLTGLLKEIGIPDANVEIGIFTSGNLYEKGLDTIEILFSANKGIAVLPLKEIASGGEMSRLMLCFKYILADSISLPTLIFDEIDTGVSGEVAKKVGYMIKKLSFNHQVICITHLPQVAAMGDFQYVVYKISGPDKTVTNIKELEPEERIEEIAKMIAGHKPSAAAIENAKELLSYQKLNLNEKKGILSLPN